MQDSTYTVFHRLFVVRALCNCSLWFKHPHILEICSYFIAQNVPHAHMDKVSAKWQYISCHWSVKLILDASLTSVRPKLCPIACLHFCSRTSRLNSQDYLSHCNILDSRCPNILMILFYNNLFVFFQWHTRKFKYNTYF